MSHPVIPMDDGYEAVRGVPGTQAPAGAARPRWSSLSRLLRVVGAAAQNATVLTAI